LWPSPGLRSRSSGDVTVPAGLDALEVDSSFDESFSSIMNGSKNPDYLIIKRFQVDELNTQRETIFSSRKSSYLIAFKE
jgi:hypothetical protein